MDAENERAASGEHTGGPGVLAAAAALNDVGEQPELSQEKEIVAEAASLVFPPGANAIYRYNRLRRLRAGASATQWPWL